MLCYWDFLIIDVIIKTVLQAPTDGGGRLSPHSAGADAEMAQYLWQEALTVQASGGAPGSNGGVGTYLVAHPT